MSVAEEPQFEHGTQVTRKGNSPLTDDTKLVFMEDGKRIENSCGRKRNYSAYLEDKSQVSLNRRTKKGQETQATGKGNTH